MPIIKSITYNLNNKAEALIDILSYLEDSIEDIIILSIQEYFQDICIRSKYKYEYSKKMYGVQLIILSNIKLLVNFYVYCMGMFYMGNKGFIIGIINNSIICASVHLVHGQGDLKFKERVYQFSVLDKIVRNKCKMIILSGDFNFRFTKKVEAVPNKTVFSHYDQFYTVTNKYKYLEEDITFGFTYKYNKKEELSSTRIPSYCDRIIYKQNEDFSILKYKSLSDLVNSDHRPVYLLVSVKDIQYSDPVNLNTCWYSEISSIIYNNISLIFLIVLFITLGFICVWRIKKYN
jgi:hypothetical protein